MLTHASSGHDNWETEPGDRVEIDEPIAQVETDKVLLLYLQVISNLCYIQYKRVVAYFR